MYVCIVCMCVWAALSPHLPRFHVRPSKSRLFRSQTRNTSWKCYVENFKPGRNPVSYRKPRFCKRRVWMQVKVQNSRELKWYVSQNISSNSWNSTVNKVGVLAKFVWPRLWISGRFRQFYFLQKLGLGKSKSLKIKVSICISHSKLKRGYSFFDFHSLLWKPEKRAPFSHEKPDIFTIYLRYKVNQLSWVIFISQ